MEPPAACYTAFTAATGGLHFLWRGWGPQKNASTIRIFNPVNEQWTVQPTTGTLPPGLSDGGCASIGNSLYCFGGYNGSSRFNELHKLNIETYHWSKVQPKNDRSEWPIGKRGCSCVAIDNRTLCCFGGYGKFSSPQPGSEFTKDKEFTDGLAWTNEFHFFDVQEEIWSSPPLKGERPLPTAAFSFTKVDKNRVVLFGGNQPSPDGTHQRVNDLYLLNLKNIEMNKIEPLPGLPWPERRARHATSCLNYGEDYPKLLMSGGVDNDRNILGDMWILDVNSGTWREVTPPESVRHRYGHSITASRLEPGLTKVLVFGGKLEWMGDPIAETATLEFGLKILTQSKNAACISGDQVGFTIETSKTAKAYQWFLNENKISNEDDDYEGSTTKHLSISKCLPKHKGSYKCVVITELDTVLTSKVAILIIGLKIQTQPKNVVCKPGDNVRLTIKTLPTAQEYQWYWNGYQISDEDKDYEGSTAECLSIRKCLPKHKGSYYVVATKQDIKLTSEIATLKIDGDQLKEAEARLLGDILKAYNIEFSDSGVNIQQLCDGESGLTYEEMQFLMKENQATKNLSMNLKQKLKARVKEVKLYEEAIQSDTQVSLYYIKMLALGPAQVGKTTFIRRLLGNMQWDMDTAPTNTQPQCSTGQCELKEAFIEYKSSTVAFSSCEQKWHTFEEESMLKNELMVFISLLNEQTVDTRSSNTEPFYLAQEELSVSHVANETGTSPEKAAIHQDTSHNEAVSAKSNDSIGYSASALMAGEKTVDPLSQVEKITTETSSSEFETAQYEFHKLNCFIKAIDNDLNLVRIIINVADIGGQPAFLEMLPSLTIGPAMYLVFMNALQGLQTEYTTKFKSHNDMQARVCENYAYTAEEVIFTALSSVACLGHTDEEIEKYVSTSSNSGNTNSLALLVATFIDQIDPNVFSKTDQQLKEMLQETCFHENGLVEYSKLFKGKVLHQINNKSGGKAEVDEYREKIINLIEKRFHEYKIPACWLSLSVCLRHYARFKRVSVLSLHVCLNIGWKCFGMREEMVRVALKFLHRYIGLILYFPENKKLKDQVICNPQAVFSTINELIFNVYDPDKRNMTGVECERFLLTGCFCPDRIKVDREGLVPIKYLTDLLMHLNITAPVGRNLNTNSDEYFLPAVLQTAKIEELKIIPKGNNEEQDPEPLCVRFKTGYLPLGFVCALAANLMRTNSKLLTLLNETQNHVIYKNKFTFRFRGRYDIGLISWPKYCEFRVVRAFGAPSNEDFDSRKCCPLIKDMLTESINLVLDGMRQSTLFQRSSHYDFAFKCSNHPSNQDPGHEALAVIASECSKEMTCTKCKTVTLLTPQMSVWFGEPISLTISQQPAPRVHIEQESILLSIQASGSKPLTYQWLKNDITLSNSSNYKGSNTTTLQIKDKDSHLRGHYHCEVKDRRGRTLCSEISVVTVGTVSQEPPSSTQTVVSRDHILEIYSQLVNWKRLAAHLGLKNYDVEAIEYKAGRDVKLMRLYTLEEWKDKGILDGTATYKVLLEALIRSENSEMAIKLRELLRLQ